MNSYKRPDEPTNHKVQRRAPKIEIPDEKSNEMWYQ